MRQEISPFGGRPIGYIEDSGNSLVAHAFSGKIIGTYNPNDNLTRDFSGKPVARGNALSYLIFSKTYNPSL